MSSTPTPPPSVLHADKAMQCAEDIIRQVGGLHEWPAGQKQVLRNIVAPYIAPKPSVPQGMREAINNTIVRHEADHNWSVPQSAILVESLLAALAPHVAPADTTRIRLLEQVYQAALVVHSHAKRLNFGDGTEVTGLCNLDTAMKVYEAFYSGNLSAATPPSLPASEGNDDEVALMNALNAALQIARERQSPIVEIGRQWIEESLRLRGSSPTTAVLTRAKEALEKATRIIIDGPPQKPDTFRLTDIKEAAALEKYWNDKEAYKENEEKTCAAINAAVDEITALLSAPENKEKNT